MSDNRNLMNHRPARTIGIYSSDEDVVGYVVRHRNLSIFCRDKREVEDIVARASFSGIDDYRLQIEGVYSVHSMSKLKRALSAATGSADIADTSEAANV